MIPKKRSTWWANRSLVVTIKHRPTRLFGPRSSIVKLSSIGERHTFFPGNELPRVRTKEENQNRLLSPDSYTKVIWDFTLLLFTIMLCFTIPYAISYHNELELHNMNSFISLVFTADIIVQINTSYLRQGHLIVSRPAIMQNYMRSWLIPDVLAALPLDIFLPGMYLSTSNFVDSVQTPSPLRYLWLLKILKILRFKQVLYKIECLMSSTAFFSANSFLKRFLVAALTAHLASCIFNILYEISYSEGNYLDKHWANNKTKYLHFLHRAMQTMTSVGFGDTNISSTYERVTAMLFMILTSGLLGYFVGGIKYAIFKSSEVSVYYRDLMFDFKRYAEAKKLKKSLRTRILNHIRHLKHLANINILNESELLSLVSIPLKEQVTTYVRGFILTKINLFSKYSRNCLKTLGEKMTVQIYSPFDQLIKQGELSTELYFIIAGTVEIFHQNTGTTFAELIQGNHFGELGFFLKAPRAASARCSTYTEILRLCSFDFEKTIKSMPRDQDLTEVMVLNTKNYGLSVMGIKCYVCHELGHISVDCRQACFKVSMAKIMKNFYNRKHPQFKLNPAVFNINKESKGVNLARYGIMNTKGHKFNAAMHFTEVKAKKIWNIVRRADFRLFLKRSIVQSEVGSSGSDVDESLNSDRHVVVNGRSRKERTSTSFVSNNIFV